MRMTAVSVIVVAPWVIRNAVNVGGPALVATNGFNLNATRLTYKLMVEDKDLGSGVLDRAFRVKDKDSTFVTIPMDFTYAGLGVAGRQLLQSGSINYRVIGDITVDTPAGNFTVPYDQRGRFSSFGGTSQQSR